MKRIFKRLMQILLIALSLAILAGLLYMRHDRFGAKASGERLAKMQSKPNYSDQAFDNIELTPSLAEGVTYPEMLRKFFFSKKVRNKPESPLPVVKSNLHNLPIDSNLYIWFGHSSYLLQLDNKKILVDPVFSEYASPVRFGIKAFDHEYKYNTDDIPEIDILVITHDHWDHLDYNTILALKPKVKHIITSLGVGAHLEKWGFTADIITELYWDESANIDDLKFTAAQTRHFSGRTFKRNVTLWSSFVLESTSKKIYLGGDSGYGKHFKEIGAKYGPFDYAILENGQYNEMWRNIHMMPEEVVKVSKELNAKFVMPVHSAKFPLAHHAWDEPLIRVTEAAEAQNVKLVTPKIGEIVSLDTYKPFLAWWVGIN